MAFSRLLLPKDGSKERDFVWLKMDGSDTLL